MDNRTIIISRKTLSFQAHFIRVIKFKTPVNSETMVRIIMERGDYTKGTSIRLLSCFTGDDSSGTCFAQEPAEMLETEIIAPDFELIVSETGKLYKIVDKERALIDEKDFKRFSPKRR